MLALQQLSRRQYKQIMPVQVEAQVEAQELVVMVVLVLTQTQELQQQHKNGSRYCFRAASHLHGHGQV